MLKDMLYEESASCNRAGAESRLYTVFLVLSIICFSIAGVTAFFATSVIRGFFLDKSLPMLGKIMYTAIWVVFIAVFVASGVVAWFLKKRFNLSYDYSFVEDELRVTKVYNGRSKKYLTTISCASILRIGRCEKPSFQDVLRGIQGKPHYLTPNKTPAEEKEFIYLLVSSQLGRTLYVIECRQAMLEYLVQSAGVNKFERE